MEGSPLWKLILYWSLHLHWHAWWNMQSQLSSPHISVGAMLTILHPTELIIHKQSFWSLSLVLTEGLGEALEISSTYVIVYFELEIIFDFKRQNNSNQNNIIVIKTQSWRYLWITWCSDVQRLAEIDCFWEAQDGHFYSSWNVGKMCVSEGTSLITNNGFHRTYFWGTLCIWPYNNNLPNNLLIIFKFVSYLWQHLVSCLSSCHQQISKS